MPPHIPGAGAGGALRYTLLRKLPAADAAAVRELAGSIEALPLFRGLTRSDATDATFAAMARGGGGTMALLWGFQDSDTVSASGIHTMQAFKECGQQTSVALSPVLVMCNLHAAHNEIPAELAERYYVAAEAKAAELGLTSVRLNEIYSALGISPEEIMALGKTLVQGPKGTDPNIPVTLTGEEMGKLKQQARSLTNRYPSVFAERLSQLTKTPKNEYFSKKALEYAQFRAGEAAVLARFSEFFSGPVLPTHIAEQSSAERIKVEGLFIQAKDGEGALTFNIPWGHESPRPKQV